MAEAIVTWKAWREMMDRMERPGWSPCRFAIRTNDGRADFVFGAVSGAFGVHYITGNISTPTMTGALALSCNVLITMGIHLRSGVRIAVYSDLAEAMDSLDLANHVTEWGEVDTETDPRWATACQKTVDMWVAMGLITDESMNAEATGFGNFNGIVRRMPEIAEYGRPAKLS